MFFSVQISESLVDLLKFYQTYYLLTSLPRRWRSKTRLCTQVGSPAVRLRLARCTAWVKRWSEAMDFLQTIFKTNIFLSRIFENSIIKG